MAEGAGAFRSWVHMADGAGAFRSWVHMAEGAGAFRSWVHMAEGAGAFRPLNDEFGNPGLQARPLSSIAFLLNLHSYFFLVRHRSFRPARDETVPHPSSVFCSMGGRPQRPTICKSPFCLLLGRPRNCHTHRLRAPSISRPLRNGWESKLPGTPIPEPAY
jgi:hypothetical protein